MKKYTITIIAVVEAHTVEQALDKYSAYIADQSTDKPLPDYVFSVSNQDMKIEESE